MRSLRAHGIRIAMLIGVGLLVTIGPSAVSQALARDPEPSWRAALESLDSALAAGNVDAALPLWQAAYRSARASRDWRPLLLVGEASLRIGIGTGKRGASESAARTCYLIALFRARTQESLEGILEITEAFAALGDRDVAGYGLGIAAKIAQRRNDAMSYERLDATRRRLAASSLRVTGGTLN